MARFDRVIRGGMIVDGSRSPRFRGDIGIKDGRIACIGHIGAGEADETIDAGGLIVAPGFVDLHTQYGAPADIVIYDFDALRVLPDEVAHDLPGGEWRRIQRAEGYKYILVNGEITMRNGQPTNIHSANIHSGRLLRGGGGRVAQDR